MSRTNYPNDTEGKKALGDWLLPIEVMNLLELHNCTKIYHNRFNEIVNS